MSIKRLVVLILSLSVLMFLAGCSEDKDDNPAGPTIENKAPAFETKSVDVPPALSNAAQSGDQGAIMGVSYMNMANGMSAYSSFFTPPAQMKKLSKVNTDPWEYEWPLTDSLTIKLKVTETEIKYTWEIIQNGVDNGIIYDNWRFIYAEELKDGSLGLAYIYQEASTELMVEWSWERNELNVFNFVMFGYGNNEGEKIEITNNPDNSGEMKTYEFTNNPANLSLYYHVNWNAAGHGQWSIYNNGVVTDTREF